MVPEPLPFEQDIHELEEQLARLEAAADAPGAAEAIRRIRRELTALKKETIREPDAVGDGAGRAAPEPAADARLHRHDLRRVRRAARRPRLRRRPGHPHRVRPARRAQGPAGRPPEGQDARGAAAVLLRLRTPGRLPQGAREDEAGREVSASDHLPDRHARAPSRESAPRNAGRRNSSRRASWKCRGCRRRSSAS